MVGRMHNAAAVRARSMGLGLWVLLVYAFLLLPVVVVVMAAFSATSYLSVPPKGLTLRWFLQVLGDPAYLSAIWYSLVLATLAAIGSLVIGTAAAYGLARRQVPGAQLISAILMSPLIFPGVVIGVALLQFYSLLGLRTSFTTLLIAHVVITIPYTVRAILSSLSGADPYLEEAARVLGASRLTAFWKVVVPLIRPGVAAGGLFAFITSFDNVPVSIFILEPRRTTLPVKIFTSIEYGVDPTIAAVSTMLIAATALFLVIAERWIGFHRFV
jgi:putative spermidine/putrescine transport system permease protein